MATKRCKNGHQYDSSIYGDNCPFCPSSTSTGGTMVNDPDINFDARTHLNSNVVGGDAPTADIHRQTATMNTDPKLENNNGGQTVIRRVGGNNDDTDIYGGRKIVGMLVTYDTKPNGEVFNIYEGRNMVGRSNSCDISIPKDSNMSSQHLLILYRSVEGVYWASDNNSSNGTYVNGEFVGDKVKLNNYDLIVIGGTKFRFLAIPQE